MGLHARGKANKNGKYEQLCWTCKKATGFCSWSNKKFEPIPGWDAKPVANVVHQGHHAKKVIASYEIYDCPEYESEV